MESTYMKKSKNYPKCEDIDCRFFSEERQRDRITFRTFVWGMCSHIFYYTRPCIIVY